VGNQEKGTGTAKRKVAIPSTASNQLRIGTRDELKDPKQHQSRILLADPGTSPEDIRHEIACQASSRTGPIVSEPQ